MYQIELASELRRSDGPSELYCHYNKKQGGTNVVILAAYVYAINGEWREHDAMSHCFFCFFVDIDEWEAPNSACAHSAMRRRVL